MSTNATIFEKLMEVVSDRKQNPRANSYTNLLLAEGVEKIGAKLLEESQEVIEAASEKGDAGRQHLVHEAADVIYHLWVMLAHAGVELKDVEAELAKRFGISGLEEKASRGK